MSDNSFKVKNSLVLTPVDLSTLPNPQAGDVACDINDSNKIKRYDSATSSWVEVGDFKGPASSTDDALVKFDGTTGKLVQNTAAILSDVGALSGLTGVTSSGSATFSGALNTSSNTTESAATGSSAVITSATTSVIRLTNTSLVSVGGYAATTAGRRTTLINATGRDVIIKHEDSSVTAAQRISLGSGADISLPSGGSIDLIYNATTARHQAVGPFSSRSISANLPDARPSLNLDFANSKTLDPRITFSRNSVAHKVNEKGLLELVPENTARFDHDPVTGESKGLLIEEARTNLLSYTENFDNAVWTKSRVYIQADAEIAPDGSRTADKLVEDTSVDLTHITSQAVFGTVNQTWTFSVWAKAAERSSIFIIIAHSGANSNNIGVRCNLSNGTVDSLQNNGNGSGVSGLIIPYPNGWYRCIVSGIPDTSGTAIQTQIRLHNGSTTAYTGDGTSGLFIWGAQLEVGSFPTSYMPSSISFTSRASSASYIDADGLVKYAGSNEARQNYLPTDLSLAPKLLLEESRTNLLQYSQEFDNSYWTKNNSFILANVETAPDGTKTADKLSENGVNGSHETSFNLSSNYVSGTTYTLSVFAKAAERSVISLSFRSDWFGSLVNAAFNLSTGTFTTGNVNTIGNMQQLPNGWYRCSITATAIATGTSASDGFFFLNNGSSVSYTGDGISGLFIWGAQLEVEAYPTSYIQSSLSFTSRSSIGTYVDSDGLIKTAANNVARNNYTPSNLSLAPRLLLEESRTNLLTYTENFDNAAYTKTRSYIQADAEIAPDGSRTADKLVEDTTASATHITTRSVSFTSGSTYTFSVFAKKSERGFLRLVLGSAAFGSVIGGFFDLEQGVLGSVSSGIINHNIESFGNGWYRCSITATATATASAPMDIAIAFSTTSSTYTGDGLSGLFIWGAQLEIGAYPTSYIPSSQTFTSRASTATFVGSNGLIQSAAINVARQNYNPTNLALAPKLLLEESRTNLLQRSAEFNDVYWTKTRSSITANAAVAPDGTLSADKLVEDTTANNTHFVSQTPSFVSGTTYTLSVFAKQDTRSGLELRFTGTGAFSTNQAVVFNLLTGVGTTSVGTATFSITPYPNGWYRCSITATADSTGSAFAAYRLDNGTSSTYTGDGISGLFIWGAQLEVGAYPTSYIPTVAASVTRSADVSSSASVVRSADVSTSAAVTRAADVSSSAATTREADFASMTGENFSSWYRQDEGTFVSKAYARQGITAGNIFRISDGTFNNYIVARSNTSSFTDHRVRTFGVDQAIMLGVSSISGSLFSASFTCRINSFAVSTNGEAVVNDSAGTVPVVDRLFIGDTGTFSESWNGHISSISYYPERLSNAQIQAMSGTINGLVGSSADQAPTNSMLGSLAFLDKLVDSNVVQIQPAPASFSVGGSLSASNVRSKIIVFNGSSASLQLPTGVSLELSEMSRLADASFDFSVIASGVGSATLTVNTGVTIVGNAVVSSGATGMFRARRTSANNYVVYRIG